MKKLLSFLVLIILLIPNVMAWMPGTHTYLGIESIKSTSNSPVGSLALQHWDTFIACDVLTDISVFLYFSEGFSSISKT